MTASVHWDESDNEVRHSAYRFKEVRVSIASEKGIYVSLQTCTEFVRQG